MTRSSILWALRMALMTATAGIAFPPTAEPSVPASAGKGTNEQVTAYYFHGTVRGETCLNTGGPSRFAGPQPG